MKAHELRAKAEQIKAEAKRFLDECEARDGGMADDDEARLSAWRDEALGLLAEAEKKEAREAMLAELDRRIASGGDRRASDPLPHQDPGNTRGHSGEQRGYSLLKAIRQMATKNETLDGLELEVSQEIAQRTGRSPKGFFMPTDLEVRTERRDLTVSTGAGSIYTDVQKGTWIDLLRNRTLARLLGVTIMADMSGQFAIPKKTASTVAYWVTEGNAPTESNPTVGQLAFAPSTVGGFTDYTRKFLIQSSFDAEQFIRQDLAETIAIEIDRVTFEGSGSGAEPEGIITNSSVNVVAIGTDGGPLTYAKVVEAETAIAIDNALNGRLAWVTTPAAKGQLKTTQQFEDTNGVAVWRGNEVDGYPAYASNQVPADLTKGSGTALSAAIFGDWGQAIWAFWTGLDVLVDPYTGGTAGTVRIVMLQDVDFQVRHPQSFAVIKDIDT